MFRGEVYWDHLHQLQGGRIDDVALLAPKSLLEAIRVVAERGLWNGSKKEIIGSGNGVPTQDLIL